MKLSVKVKETLDAVTRRPSDEIRDQNHRYQCTVQNASQFEMRLENSYFKAGKYLEAPKSVGPYGQMSFTAYNDRFGASTGLWFSAHLDEARRFDFAVGLDAPSTGGFKVGVVESNSAKTGLENATREGGSINSRFRFKGKDSDGDDRVIEFYVVAYPGMEMEVIATQLIVNSNDD